jgi:hypothetical protein
MEERINSNICGEARFDKDMLKYGCIIRGGEKVGGN